MPKKKVKKRKKKIITKRKTKVKSLAPKQEKELIYRTKKDWISKALVNKSQYEKKYKSSIKDNDGFWKKEGKRINWICLLYTSPSPRDSSPSRMPSSA